MIKILKQEMDKLRPWEYMTLVSPDNQSNFKSNFIHQNQSAPLSNKKIENGNDLCK